MNNATAKYYDYISNAMARLFLSFLLVLIIIKSEAQAVYKTPSGAKYHLEACRMVKNVSEKITLEEAAKIGLEPCKICKPQAGPLPLQSAKKEKGEDRTVQCKGSTKKGSRCKHMTSIADGYCYQHRPE